MDSIGLSGPEWVGHKGHARPGRAGHNGRDTGAMPARAGRATLGGPHWAGHNGRRSHGQAGLVQQTWLEPVDRFSPILPVDHSSSYGN